MLNLYDKRHFFAISIGCARAIIVCCIHTNLHLTMHTKRFAALILMLKMLADYIVAESIEIPSTMNGIAATPVYKDCERQCPYYYYPICATNGNEMRMFVNACEMFAHNCDVEKKFRRIRNTNCKDYKEYVDDTWLNSIKPKAHIPLMSKLSFTAPSMPTTTSTNPIEL